MRPPIRSESDAFRFTIAAALVLTVCIVIGWLVAPLVGVAVLALAALIAGLAYIVVGRRDRPARLQDAAHAPHPHRAPPGGCGVLVIANETLAGAELRERLLAHGDRLELDVLAPALSSRLHRGVSDIDAELERARERLEHSLAWARAQGFSAHGKVGDPSVATALEDELRDFGPDEVIIVTHSGHGANRQERRELDRLRRELDVQVTHIALD
jgi:hypothetical protein